MTRRKPEVPKTDVDLLRLGIAAQRQKKAKMLPERFEMESVPGCPTMRFRDKETGNEVDIALCRTDGAIEALAAFFTPEQKSRMLDVETCTDWNLICAVNWCSVTNDLPEALAGELMNETWALQDGYGEAGYTSPQGWDWSGIRDSTPGAQKEMASVIRIRLRCKNIKHMHLTMRSHIAWD